MPQEELINDLKNAVHRCRTIHDRSGRDVVINGLPDRLRAMIIRQHEDDLDVTNLVYACLIYPDGMKLLVDMIKYIDGDTDELQAVIKAWHAIQPPIRQIINGLLIVAGIWLLLVVFAILTGSVIFSTGEVILSISPSIALILTVIIAMLVPGRSLMFNDLEGRENQAETIPRESEEPGGEQSA